MNSEYKKCYGECKKIQPKTNFHKNASTIDKLARECKECVKNRSKKRWEKDKEKMSEQSKVYRENNKEKVSKQKKVYVENNKEKVAKQKKIWYENNKVSVSEKGKVYRENNKEKINKQKKIWYENNKEKVAKQKKIWYENNPERASEIEKKSYNKNKEKRKQYVMFKLKTDINFKLCYAIRSRVRTAIKRNMYSKKIRNISVECLECSIKELIDHLESQFYPDPKTGEMMSWDNWSRYGWHIDHIIPLASFDLTDPEQFKKACHYTNLQPMWAWQNLKKGKKVNIF